MPPKKKTEKAATSKPKRAAAPKKTTKAVKKTTAPKVAKTAKSPSKTLKVVKSSSRAKPAAAPSKKNSALGKLPRLGETRLMVFIRDPQCLFTYWEVTPESLEAAKKQLGEEYKGSSMVLRVFHTGPDGEDELLYEVTVEPDSMNHYLEIPGVEKGYVVEVARRGGSGRLVVLARSNRIPALGSAFPSGSSSAPGEASVEMPAGLRDYFSQDGEEEFLLTPGGISSAESLKRKRNKSFSSFH